MGQQTSPDHDPVVQGTRSQRTLLCLTTIVSGSKCCPLEPPNSRERSDSWRFPTQQGIKVKPGDHHHKTKMVTQKNRIDCIRLPPFYQDVTYFYRLGVTILVGGFTASSSMFGSMGIIIPKKNMQNMKPPGFLMSWTVSLALVTSWNKVWLFPSRNPWFTATYHNLHHEGSR